MTFRATLVVDGSSDRALKPVIEWLLQQHLPIGAAFEVTVAKLPGKHASNDRLRLSWQYFAGDVLFIHRDAEKESLLTRQVQIDEWVAASFSEPPPYVRVVPIRMTEAWLLLSEEAIREAAGNPNGNIRLQIPAVNRLDALPDPKEVLLDLLRQATENTPRRRRSFNERQAIHRLADFQQEIGFHALRVLPAFAALEQEVQAMVSVMIGS
jgi:hypothetical protein